MGHGPRRAVVILWLWTALLSAVVLLPTFTDRGNSLVPLGVVGSRPAPLRLLPPRRPERPRGSGAGEGVGGTDAESVVELDEHRRKRASG